MRLLFATATAALMTVAVASSASAADEMDLCSDGLGLPCWTLDNDHESTVEAALLAATGLNIDLTLYGKSDAANAAALFSFTGLGTKDGSWDVLDDSVKIAFITVKASNRYSLFDVGGVNSGDWTTLGLVNNGGKQPDVSHISFWTAPTQNMVPEPAAWALMLAGFGLVGFAARRRRAAFA